MKAAKRILAVLLAALMSLGLFAFHAGASGPQTESFEVHYKNVAQGNPQCSDHLIGDVYWYPDAPEYEADGRPGPPRTAYEARYGLRDPTPYEGEPNNGLRCVGFADTPGGPKKYNVREIITGANGSVREFYALWQAPYFNFQPTGMRSYYDWRRQGRTQELKIAEFDGFALEDIDTFVMTYVDLGVTKQVPYSFDSDGVITFAVHESDYTCTGDCTSRQVPIRPVTFTLKTKAGDTLARDDYFFELCSIDLAPVVRWWQTLPSFLQLILRYLFFGWIWMNNDYI